MSQRFFQLNMQFTRTFRKKLNEHLFEVGLYYSQWSIVYYLKQCGSATLVEITNYLEVEKPTISRTVKRLEELREMYLSVQEIPFLNGGAYGAYMKSIEMYYSYMDEMLADMGYTAQDE